MDKLFFELIQVALGCPPYKGFTYFWMLTEGKALWDTGAERGMAFDRGV